MGLMLINLITYIFNVRCSFVKVIYVCFLGSPFLLNVGGDPSGRIRETITKDMEQAEAITPNTFCQFLLKIPGKSIHSVKMLNFRGVYLLASNVLKSYRLDPD